MISTKSNKKNKVYEYYTSFRAVKEGFNNCKIGSIPAGEMDNFVLRQIAGIIKSPKILSGLIKQAKSYVLILKMCKLFPNYRMAMILFRGCLLLLYANY